MMFKDVALFVAYVKVMGGQLIISYSIFLVVRDIWFFEFSI